MARSSRPASDHGVIFLTNCCLSNTMSLGRGAVVNRPGFSRAAEQCWWPSSPPSKVESSQTLSIAKPAFTAEPTNRIPFVAAFLRFPPDRALDWSAGSVFVKKCSPTAQLASSISRPGVTDHRVMRNENQQVYRTWALTRSRNLQSAHACPSIHNLHGPWLEPSRGSGSGRIYRPATSASILERRPRPSGASSLIITRCLTAGERKRLSSLPSCMMPNHPSLLQIRLKVV